MARKKKYWRIVGRDSTKKIFEESVPLGSFTDGQMEKLLQVLAARAGLSFQEIIDAYSRTNSRRYRPLLEVKRQSRPKFTLSCGSNPYFVATVIEE